MPSLFTTRISKVLPIAFILLYLSIHTIAAPFTPITEKPVPIFNNGLNLYPEETDDYSFNDEDQNFNKDFQTSLRNIREQHRELMKKVNGGFIDEFVQTPNDPEQCNQREESQGGSLTGGDVFHRSGSNDVKGRGKLRVTPGRKRRVRHPLVNLAKANPGNFVQNDHYQYPPQSSFKKRDLDPGMLSPQTVCDFLQLSPACSEGLTLPFNLQDMPIVSIEVEHTEISWQMMEDSDASESTPEDLEDLEVQLPQFTTPGALEQASDLSIPLFLKIDFLPSAAEALGVSQAAMAFLDLPLSSIPIDIPYTETISEYHETHTICITREVGPFVVCERVYGEQPAQDDTGESVDPDTDLEDPATTTPETEPVDLDTDPEAPTTAAPEPTDSDTDLENPATTTPETEPADPDTDLETPATTTPEAESADLDADLENPILEIESVDTDTDTTTPETESVDPDTDLENPTSEIKSADPDTDTGTAIPKIESVDSDIDLETPTPETELADLDADPEAFTMDMLEPEDLDSDTESDSETETES